MPIKDWGSILMHLIIYFGDGLTFGSDANNTAAEGPSRHATL